MQFEHWTKQIINLASATPVTVFTGKVVIGRIWTLTALSAHAVPIADGSLTLWSIPASTAANTLFEHLRGIRCDTSLIITPNAAATGTIGIAFLPL